MSVRKNFAQWMQTLEALSPSHMEMGLERIREVALRAQLLHFSCPVITVAGTNGKGSTVAILAKLLKEAGLKVGTYTSPHLLDFKERIQIGGEQISEAKLCEAFEKVENGRQNTYLTFFEFTTLAAFSIFQDPQYAVEVVILEVGLGGRLDAVNVVSPQLAIITTIGLDHMEWLGNNTEAIAGEKAGILRKNIPVILGASAYHHTSMQSALQQHHARAYVEQRDFDYCDASMTQWQCNGKVIKIPPTHLPPMSVSLALAAYTILEKEFFSLPAISKSVNNIEGLMMWGRAHRLQWQNKTLVFDVAHNADGSQWLADKLDKITAGKKIRAVWASLKDKALAEIILPMRARVDTWYIGELEGVERRALVSQLTQSLKQHAIENYRSFTTIREAFAAALEDAHSEEVIVVFGSFFTVSTILEKLGFVQKHFQDNGLFYAKGW